MSDNPFEAPKHWVSILAAKQRARDKSRAEFSAAIPAFAQLLMTAINADLQQYESEFPGRKVTVNFNPEEQELTITCTTYNPMPRATAIFHTETRKITCVFDNTSRDKRWEEQLDLSQIGIGCKKMDAAHCAKELAEKILMPVLFPNL